MKKTMLGLIIFLLVATSINVALAQKFSGIRVDDKIKGGDFIEVHANVRNNLDKNIEKGKIVFYIPELEIYEKTSSFDIEKNINYGRYMHIYVPENTNEGLYLARISFMHNGKTQHQWRWVYVE
jgi:hypothetical protein